jgi:hypothetical protein
MAARWYSPAAGQFTSRDAAAVSPVPDPAAANPFAYVDDNPLTRTDPTGAGWWQDITHAVSRAWDDVTSVALGCPDVPAACAPPSRS